MRGATLEQAGLGDADLHARQSRADDFRERVTGAAELGMTEGFDVGLEMSGAEAAFNQMLDSMNHGGRIAVLGIPAGPMTLDGTNTWIVGSSGAAVLIDPGPDDTAHLAAVRQALGRQGRDVSTRRDAAARSG